MPRVRLKLFLAVAASSALELAAVNRAQTIIPGDHVDRPRLNVDGEKGGIHESLYESLGNHLVRWLLRAYHRDMRDKILVRGAPFSGHLSDEREKDV